jgi:hypothetical protein
MITLRPASERGQTKLNGLISNHTFSFGEYYDLKHVGFGHLRVINDDLVMPGKGFGTHFHRDMEIITYVLEGEVTHKDSTGNHDVVAAGEVQRMSAGTGISYSEYNLGAAPRLGAAGARRRDIERDRAQRRRWSGFNGRAGR